LIGLDDLQLSALDVKAAANTRITAGVNGKRGMWRKKPQTPNPPLGAAFPKVWANARTCLVLAVLGGFLETIN